ncbi:MAG: hypothetical protein JWP32_2992 [Schumannella sp.]|nr:hypothetical protein [Schumannella sp.]
MTTSMNQDAGRDTSGATSQAPADTEKNLQAASGNEEQSAQNKADDPIEGSTSPEVTGEDDEETSEIGEESEDDAEEDEEDGEDEAEGEGEGGKAGLSPSAIVAQHTSGGSPGGLSGD